VSRPAQPYQPEAQLPQTKTARVSLRDRMNTGTIEIERYSERKKIYDLKLSKSVTKSPYILL